MISSLFFAFSVACCIFAARWDVTIPAGNDMQSRKLFQLADKNHDHMLTENEFELILMDFDTDHDNRVSSAEFLNRWINRSLGSQLEAVVLFQYLDVDNNGYVTSTDFPMIMSFFDRDGSYNITEAEFVIQWYKISHIIS